MRQRYYWCPLFVRKIAVLFYSYIQSSVYAKLEALCFFSNKKTNDSSAQVAVLERRIEALEKENELYKKIKDVADLRSQYSLDQFTHMENLRNLWFRLTKQSTKFVIRWPVRLLI